MIVTQSENLVYVDVDNTLIHRNPLGEMSLDYYGINWYITPCSKNIEFLMSLKSRGYYVIVHSSNGWKHALNVVNLLELNAYVDEIKTKPQKYIDDENVQDWFGPKIYFEEI